MSKPKPIGNLILLVVLATLTTIYFFDVQTLPNKEERIVVETLYYLLLVLLMIEGIKSIILIVKGKAKIEINGNSSFRWDALLKNKQMILVVSLILYVLLIPFFGFFATSFIYMLLLNNFLNNRKTWQIILIPLLVLTGSYLLFVQALGIRLPSGIFL